MALTGLKILKLLPGTNCKECGVSTCLAFAIKLAAKKADLSLCPYASDEAKRILGAAAEPPVRKVALGSQQELNLGGETVLYRHEKTFVNPTALAVCISDANAPEAAEAALAAIGDYTLQRVGETFQVDMVAVAHEADRVEFFAGLAAKAWEMTQRPLVLLSRDPDALTAAARAVEGSRSLLASAMPETAEVILPVARDNGHALAVTAPDLNALVQLTSSIAETGFRDLVLDFQTHTPAERFQTNSIARRAAIRGVCRPLGYPCLRRIDARDPLDATIDAVTEIAKYGGVCVLPQFDPAMLAALLTLRLNLYTDPQKPIQVEPKLYPIGEPHADSPVFVTTNFSLTYFLVSGEIENAGISAWLVVPECEGMSVLTAWAAGKFTGETIGKFCKGIGLSDRVQTRQIVIPGYVSQISGDLEEALPGWKVVVGPQEAADIESFIKQRIG